MYHRLERELARDRMRSRSCAREKSSKSRSMFCMMWMDEKLFLSSRSPAKVNKSSWNRFSLQSSTIFRMCQRLFFFAGLILFLLFFFLLMLQKRKFFDINEDRNDKKTGCNTIDCQKTHRRSSKKELRMLIIIMWKESRDSIAFSVCLWTRNRCSFGQLAKSSSFFFFSLIEIFARPLPLIVN